MNSNEVIQKMTRHRRRNTRRRICIHIVREEVEIDHPENSDTLRYINPYQPFSRLRNGGRVGDGVFHWSD